MTKRSTMVLCISLLVLLGWSPATGDPGVCFVQGQMLWNDDPVTMPPEVMDGFQPLEGAVIVLQEIIPIDPLSFPSEEDLIPLEGGYVDMQPTDALGMYSFTNVPVVATGNNFYNFVVTVFVESLPRSGNQEIKFEPGMTESPPRVPLHLEPSSSEMSDFGGTLFPGQPGSGGVAVSGAVSGSARHEFFVCDGVLDEVDVAVEDVAVWLEYVNADPMLPRRMTTTNDQGRFEFLDAFDTGVTPKVSLDDFPIQPWDAMLVTADSNRNGVLDMDDQSMVIDPGTGFNALQGDLGFDVDDDGIDDIETWIVLPSVDLDFEVGCTEVVIAGRAYVEGASPNGMFDAGDKPLSGVDVGLHDALNLPVGDPTYTDATDPDGLYSFAIPSDGIYGVYHRYSSPNPGGVPAVLTREGRTVRIISRPASDTDDPSEIVDIVLLDDMPPTIVCDDMTLECTGPDGPDDSDYDPPSVLFDDFWAPDEITLTYVPRALKTAGGPFAVTCTATDGSGNSAECQFMVTVVDTTPPVITLVGDDPVILECGVDTWTDPGATVFDACALGPDGASIVGAGMVDDSVPDTYVVTYDTVDAAGNAAAQVTRTVIVQDTISPTITSVTATPDTLWPPNRKLVCVSVAIEATDICDPSPTCRIVSVASNQSPNWCRRNGPDWFITGDTTLQLLAERDGGRERIYTITVECVDSSGNADESSVLVRVPKSQGRSSYGAKKAKKKKYAKRYGAKKGRAKRRGHKHRNRGRWGE